MATLSKDGHTSYRGSSEYRKVLKRLPPPEPHHFTKAKHCKKSPDAQHIFAEPLDRWSWIYSDENRLPRRVVTIYGCVYCGKHKFTSRIPAYMLP